MKRILVDDGYYENGNYYFYVNDHLGNNRVVANAVASVIQSTQYYPFGSSFADATGTSTQPYKYNGKELDGRNGLNMYDYGARWKFDWNFTTVDPLAELHYNYSPYAYVLNNSMQYVDPLGMDTVHVNEILDWQNFDTENGVIELNTISVVPKEKGSSEVREYYETPDFPLGKYPDSGRIDGLGMLSPEFIVLSMWRSLFLATSRVTTISTTAIPKTGSQLLLKSGPAGLTQKGLEHIVKRHWFSSGVRGVGKFVENLSSLELKEMIRITTTEGVFRPNTMGRLGTIAEYNFGKVIGTTSSGIEASSLRVVIGTNGNVITAFPF